MLGLKAEDVGMAEGEFAYQSLHDIIDGEAAFFLGDLGMENDLEKNISEFFFHVGVIFFADGLLKFVGFFKEIFEKRLVRLLAVPGASLG